MEEQKLIHGKRYIITVSLNWVESFAPDGLIVNKFTENGFKDVQVHEDHNDAKVRIVEGTWDKPDDVMHHEKHLVKVTEA